MLLCRPISWFRHATRPEAGTRGVGRSALQSVLLLSAMVPHVTALERAFQLAQSGNYATVEAIRKQLKAERYSIDQIKGPTLARQLFALIQTARGKSQS